MKTQKKPLFKRKRFRLCAVGMMALIVLISSVFAALFIFEPIRIEALSQQIEQSIQEKLGDDASVSIAQSHLGLSRKGVIINLDNVQISAQQAKAAIIHSEVSLSLWKLLQGQIQLNHLKIVDGVITPTQTQRSPLVFLSSLLSPPVGTPGQGGLLSPMVSLLAGFDQSLKSLEQGHQTAPLPDIDFENIALRDSKGNTHFLTGGFKIDPSFTLKASIISDEGVWALDVNRRQQGDEGIFSYLHVKDMSLHQIAPKLANKKSYLQLDVPVFISIGAQSNEAGLLEKAQIQLETGAGYMIVAQKHPTIIDQASARLTWDKDHERFLISDTGIFSGRNGFTASGVLTSGSVDGVDGIDLALLSKDISLDKGSEAELPLTQGALEWHMRWPKNASYISLEKANLTIRDAVLQASGKVSWEKEKISQTAPHQKRKSLPFTLSMQVRNDPMDVETLKHIWPIVIAPGARHWVRDNVVNGKITQGMADLNLTEGTYVLKDHRLLMAEEALNMRVGFQKVSLKLPPDLPQLNNVEGTLDLGGQTIRMDARKGKLALSKEYQVAVPYSVLSVENYAIKPVQARLNLQLEADAASLIAIASLKPIRANTLNLKPSQAKGTARVDLAVDLPLKKGMRRDEIEVLTDIAMKNFSYNGTIQGQKIAKGNLRLTNTKGNMQVKGTATLNTIETEIDYRLGENAGLSVIATLDDKERKELGFDLGERLKGPIKISISDDKNSKNNHYKIDLTKAHLSIAELRWRKAAGVPATLTFLMRDKGEQKEIEDIFLTTKGLEAKGSAQLIGNNLTALSFPSINIVNAGTLTISMQKKNNLPFWQISAPSLKVSMKELTKPGSGKPIKINAKIGQLISEKGASLNNVNLDMMHNGTQLQNFTFDARTPQKGIIRAKLIKALGQDAQINVTSGDAGSLVRFLGLYERIRGGQMVGNISVPAKEKALSGKIFIEKFRVVNEPAMGKLLATKEARNQGRDQVERVQKKQSEDANNVQFDKLSVRFARDSQQLNLSEVIVKGPSIGANLKGTLNYKANTIAMTGTYVPFYRLNTFFSQIPVLGLALGGRKNEGLIGVNFRIKGTLDQPELQINPVSAVVPGIARRIFEFQ